MFRPVFLCIVLGSMMLGACASLPTRISSLRPCTPPAPVTTMKVPYPILLLHGLGQKADVWDGAATRYFSKDLGLSSGGVLRVVNGTVESSIPGGGDGDFYVVSFRNPHDSVGAWGRELETCIDHVLAHTGADRVILIGYSMGGLAARSYLTKRYSDHHVKRLITVGTPHLGSPFARVWTWKSMMKTCADSSNVVLSPICKAALATLQGTEGDVPYDAPAVRDLRRPEDGGVYLRRLGKLAHPMDIEYVSVIGELDMFAEARKLSEGWIQDILRRAIGAIGSGVPALFETGDGVVSARSQDIMNIEYFTVDPVRRRATRTVNVGSVHVEHLRQSFEIQRVALDEKAEYKGSEVCRIGDRPFLVVSFTDHIPSLCALRIDLTTDAGERTILNAEAGAAVLVRTPSGMESRFVVPLDAVPSALTSTTHLRIAITNTFGHVVTATKDW